MQKIVELGILISLFLIITYFIIPEYITTPELVLPSSSNNITSYTPSKEDKQYDYLVVLQAGHCTYDNMYSCKEKNTYRNTGTHGYGIREQDLTIIIANKTKQILLEHGIPSSKILVIGAHKKSFNKYKKSKIKHFISIHFDGSKRKCATGTSVGYPETYKTYSKKRRKYYWVKYNNTRESKKFATSWKNFYSKIYPSDFKFMKDNFTESLKGYYMYSMTDAKTDLLIEFAELTCRKSARWVNKYRDKLGDTLALFLLQELKPIHKKQQNVDDLFN